jgi:chloride channel core
MALDKILVIFDEMYESDVMIKLNVMTDSSV